MAGIPAGRLNIEIVAEVARLQADLQKVKSAVNAASKDIAASAKYANDNIDGMTTSLGRASAASKAMQANSINLARNMSDVAQGFALGQPPMTIFLQQGFQITEVLALMRAEAKANNTSLGAMFGNFLKGNPLILAAAAAAGVLAAAVGGLTAAINDNQKVQVTWTDVVLGAFDVVKEAVSTRVTAAFKAMGLDIGDVWNSVVKYTKAAINFMIGSVVAVPKMIAATYDKIPAAIGDAFYSAANMGIRGLNALAQGAVEPLNIIVRAFNNLFDKQIPEIVVGGLGELANPYAGAMSKLGAAGSKSLVDSFSKDYVGGIIDVIDDAARKRAALRKAAEKGGKDIGEAAGKAAGKGFNDEFAKAVADAIKAAEKAADFLIGGAGQVGKGMGDFWGDFVKGSKDAIDEINEAQRAINEANRNRALDTANDIADIIGGGVGNAISDLADALDQKFPEFMQKVGKALGGLDSVFKNFGDGAVVGGTVGRYAGSGQGGAIGGGLGNIAGQALAPMLGKLGQFAGPLGAIAGGLLGGIIGGLLTSTPRASATVSIIAGKAMETAITGNSDKLKKIAGGMADGLIAGLEKIASSLGAEIVGDARVSVGVRKGNYRVDPTGQGITKTSRGAIDFGEDKAAAEAYALLVALRQLDFTGVSASVKTLLTLTDDLASNLEKATQFKSVFDELAKRDDPAKFAQDEITRWRTAMDKIFAEAGATAEELAELERLTGLKRLDAAKEAADALAAKAAEEAAKAKAIADEAAGLNLRLAEAMGNSEEVLRLRREAELAAVDPLNKALLEMVYAAEDAAEATRLVTEAQEAAAAAAKKIADERRALQIQLYDTIGNPLGEQMRREDTLAGLDPSNRQLQEQIFNALDVAKSAAEAAAAEATRLAERERNRSTRDSEMQAAIAAHFTDTPAWMVATAANDNAADYNAEMRSRLTAAYDRESAAMQTVIDQFTEMAKSLKEFRAGLFGQENGFQTFGSLQARLTRAGSLARGGDLAAMQSIPGLGNDFLTAARGMASSLLDYQRNVAFVASIADQAIAGAEEQADIEQQKLDLLNKQVEGQIETNRLVKALVESVDDIVNGRVAIRTEAEAA